MYPYQFRVVPYYRNTNLMQWNPNHLTAQHFKSFTDLIYFNVGCDTEGNLTGQNNAQFLNGLDKLKNLAERRAARSFWAWPTVTEG